MKKNYDLTTIADLREATGSFRRKPIIKHVLGKELLLAEKGLGALDKMADSGTLDKVVDRIIPGKSVEKQKESAADLIKSGKESGVRKMNITMDEKAGAYFECPVEGVNISAGIGSKDKVTLEVEYFPDSKAQIS